MKYAKFLGSWSFFWPSSLQILGRNLAFAGAGMVCLLGLAELGGHLLKGYCVVHQEFYSERYHHWPRPEQRDQSEFLSFNSVRPAFGSLPLQRLREWEFEKVRSVVLSTLPPKIRWNALRVIDQTFKFAHLYQIDPFWILAVMWTESHFKPKAKSPVQALGLMQIMPGTSYFLANRMNWRIGPRLAYTLAGEASANIEMGVHYLDYLLQSFSGNFKLATVAYNLGPGRVRRRLKERLPVGVRNQYLDKVMRRYFFLTRPFRKHFRKTALPSQRVSYVAAQRGGTEFDFFKIIQFPFVSQKIF